MLYLDRPAIDADFRMRGLRPKKRQRIWRKLMVIERAALEEMTKAE